jgi:hypothetical protein
MQSLEEALVGYDQGWTELSFNALMWNDWFVFPYGGMWAARRVESCFTTYAPSRGEACKNAREQQWRRDFYRLTF